MTWKSDFDEYKLSKKTYIPIDIFPTFFADDTKDRAINEFDRLYNILVNPYIFTYNNARQENVGQENEAAYKQKVADKFVKNIIEEYQKLFFDVNKHNDIEVGKILAEDSKQLTHFANVIYRAEQIDIKLNEDETICEVYVKDDNNHRVHLSRGYIPTDGKTEGLNDRLFNDIADGINQYIHVEGVTDIRIRNDNRSLSDIKKVVEDAVRERIYFETDVRTSTRQIAVKCKPLYRFIAEHREAFGLNRKKYAYDVGKMVTEILDLNIDVVRMVEIIQGKY